MANGLLNAGSFPQPPTRGGLLGLDEDELRRARLAALLTGLGTGLLGGRNLPEGLSLGFQQAHRGMEASRRDLIEEAEYRREVEREAAEDAERQRQREAVTRFSQGVDDPNKRAFLEAFPSSGASLIGKDLFPEPFKPDLETIWRGEEAEQGYWGRDGDWVKVGGGRRFAPVQGPQVPQTATVWDPKALDGKGAYVYAPGTKLAGQVARPGSGDTQPSSYSQRQDDFRAAGIAEKDLAAAMSTDPDKVERYIPIDPPRNPETGEIDPDQLDTDTRYRLPDGTIYLWDGANFIPYE